MNDETIYLDKKTMRAVARAAEKAFRRGFQHGFMVATEKGAKLPSTLAVAKWRYPRNYYRGAMNKSVSAPGMPRFTQSAVDRLTSECWEFREK